MLLDKLTDVITRPGFSERLSRIGKSTREVLADYLDTIELVEPIGIPRIVRDPDDDHVLACALAAKAELIVFGDKDLLVLHEYQDIPILPPRPPCNTWRRKPRGLQRRQAERCKSL